MSSNRQTAVKDLSAQASDTEPHPQDVQAIIALYTAGRLAEAEVRALLLLEEFPHAIDVYNLLGAVQGGLGKMDQAIASYRQAITINPRFAEAHNNLGVILRKCGRFEEAIASYQAVLRINPNMPEAHNNLGTMLLEIDKLEEAAASYGQAVRLQPDFAGAHSNLGRALLKLGKFEEAIASLEQALKIKPDCAEAVYQLAFSGEQTIAEEDLGKIEDIFTGPDLTSEQKMYIAFGLGKAFEDLEEYEKSFSYVVEGNRLRRANTTYSIEDTRIEFRRVQEMFCPAFFNDRKGSGKRSNAPIFVLGMPRSGTTLVEQILASHPDVFGAGELTDLNSVVFTKLGERGLTYPEGITQLDDAELEGLARDYLASLARRGVDALRITDKLPHNFLNVGLINLILPSASIIHVRRDPIDTCLSIFTRYFEKSYPFAYDLSELGIYYRLYEELMEHWRQVIPDAMFEVSYEKLVNEPESNIRAMLDHCSLSFNPACLDFHKTERPVRTASAWQVRQPMYRSSVQKWQRYGDLLDPLRAALEGRTA